MTTDSRNFTLRLLPEDQQQLADLCEDTGLDRTKLLRDLIRRAAQKSAPWQHGRFTLPDGTSVELTRKVVDDK